MNAPGLHVLYFHINNNCMSEPSRALALPFPRTVHCDITGTLVIPGGLSKPDTLVEDVREFLRFMRDEKKCEIVLCSRIEDNALAVPEIRKEFGYVVGKAILGNELDMLVDNNPDECLMARVCVDPKQLTGFAALNNAEKHAKLEELLRSSTRQPELPNPAARN
jgi:hypothetical protein